MFRFGQAREELVKTVLKGSKGVFGPGSIAVLPKCDTAVFCHCLGRSLHVHSLEDGRRMRSLDGSISGVKQIIVLDQDIVLSAHNSSSVCVWRVSNGELLHKARLVKRLDSVAALSEGTVIVGCDNGALAEMKWTGSSLFLSGRRVAAGEVGHTGCILEIAAALTRFATRSEYGSVNVWDVQSFRCVATLNSHFFAVGRAMNMNERWLAMSSDNPPGIYVYDTNTFSPQHVFHYSSDEVLADVELSDDNGHLLAGFHSGLKVYEIASGRILWSIEALPGLRIATCKGGRGLVAPYKHGVKVWGLPLDVAAKLTPFQQLVPVAAKLPVLVPPFQDAFASVLAATCTAASYCRHLVTAENCSASVAEWHSAHQLLMLAIHDAQLPRSIDFEGKKSWWFDQLYISARAFDLSEVDANIVRNCLREAKDVGVIEGEQTVLASIRIAEDIRTDRCVIQSTCAILCSRIVGVEGAVDKLKESLESYTRTQRVSQLIGIGLQLVPFIGGAAAGVITAGAEVISGLGVKDIVEAALGIGVNASQGRVVSFTERVLSMLNRIFSEDQVARLEGHRRNRLEGLGEECGFSLEALRLRFREAQRRY